MKKKNILIILLVVGFFTCVNADYAVKTRIYMDTAGIVDDGDEVKETISEDWIGNNRMVTYKDDKNKVFIVDLTGKRMVLLNHKAKKYLEVSLPFQMANIVSGDAASLMNMVKMELSVAAPGSETKKIGKWKCSRYDLELKMLTGTIKMTYWVTTDVPFDWEKYALMYSYVARMSFIKNSEEFQKIKGYPIFTEFESNMMGISMKGTTTVLDISEKEAPAEIYTVPAGYEKLDKFQPILLKK